MGALAVGDGYVYWQRGGGEDEELFRVPVDGGSSERMPLDVSGWSQMEWTDGYLVGRGLTLIERARPEELMSEGLGISLDGLGTDGQSVFFTGLGNESCVAQVRGGGERVDIASFDPTHMLVADMVGTAEYVYSAVVLTERQLIVPDNPVTRILRIPRP